MRSRPLIAGTEQNDHYYDKRDESKRDPAHLTAPSWDALSLQPPGEARMKRALGFDESVIQPSCRFAGTIGQTERTPRHLT
jgi:hypothetical protein